MRKDDIYIYIYVTSVKYRVDNAESSVRILLVLGYYCAADVLAPGPNGVKQTAKNYYFQY